MSSTFAEIVQRCWLFLMAMSDVSDSDPATSVNPDEQARDFSRRTWREDAEILVEGRTLYVASNILSLMSPVFTSIFEESFKGDEIRRIELKGEKHDDVVLFLRCLYPNTCQQITKDNVFAVLKLAHMFEVEHLKKRCDDFLVEGIREVELAKTICEHLQFAYSWKLVGLRAACVKLVAQMNTKDISEAEKDYPLPSEVKVEVQAMQIEDYRTDVETLLNQTQFYKRRYDELIDEKPVEEERYNILDQM